MRNNSHAFAGNILEILINITAQILGSSILVLVSMHVMNLIYPFQIPGFNIYFSDNKGSTGNHSDLHRHL